jgi:hypothetical protein
MPMAPTRDRVDLRTGLRFSATELADSSAGTVVLHALLWPRRVDQGKQRSVAEIMNMTSKDSEALSQTTSKVSTRLGRLGMVKIASTLAALTGVDPGAAKQTKSIDLQVRLVELAQCRNLHLPTALLAWVPVVCLTEGRRCSFRQGCGSRTST